MKMSILGLTWLLANAPESPITGSAKPHRLRENLCAVAV